MKKQILSLAIVSTIGLSTFLSPGFASAQLSDLQNEKEKIEQERSSLQSEIADKESKIDDIKSEQDSVASEIKRLDLAVEDATNKLEEKNAEIAQTEKEIEQLKVEIAELIERIDKRNELLKDRAASYQKNGGPISYLDVLFGAQSFSDFVDRVSAVATLVEADKNILEQHRKDKEELEAKQAEVEQKLAELQEMKIELEALKTKLNSEVAQKNELMNSLKQQEKVVHAEIIAAEEEQAVLAGQAAAIQQAIRLEQEKQAEAERQKAATVTVKQTSGGSPSSGGESSTAPATATPPVSSGSFTWPTAGTLTSGYGTRSLGYHYGIDIAKSGYVPVVAAADGVVLRSYYSSSYGNVVFVSHSINGQVYTTVYAHMNSRTVSSGAVVKKGQQIGVMGNTGQSYGQHLHFEIHKGPWNASKSNAVNPLSYLP